MLSEDVISRSFCMINVIGGEPCAVGWICCPEDHCSPTGELLST